MIKSTLNVNGTTHVVETEADMPLLWALRDLLGLTGTKFSCGAGLCGACTVLVEGMPVRSCITPVRTVADKSVTTIEAIGTSAVGKAVQAAWVELDVVQCGYCQSGQIAAAVALLSANPRPSDQQIDAHMAGNICRCGTYQRIRAAIHHAGKELSR